LVDASPAKFTALRREVVTVPARRIVVRAGETPTKLYSLYNGWCFRFVLLPDGRRQILSILLPGDLLATQAMYVNPLRYSVQSLTEVTLCVFDREDLLTALRNDPQMPDRMSARFAREAAEADERVLGLGQLTAIERVARLILRLTNKLKLRGLLRDENVEFPLRQEHIADALGLTAVHVSRTLSMLKEDGAIVMGRNALTITDRDRLVELAGNYQAAALN
jgi:CRP-like cAMP-binding protein